MERRIPQRNPPKNDRNKRSGIPLINPRSEHRTDDILPPTTISPSVLENFHITTQYRQETHLKTRGRKFCGKIFRKLTPGKFAFACNGDVGEREKTRAWRWRRRSWLILLSFSSFALHFNFLRVKVSSAWPHTENNPKTQARYTRHFVNWPCPSRLFFCD